MKELIDAAPWGAACVVVFLLVFAGYQWYSRGDKNKDLEDYLK